LVTISTDKAYIVMGKENILGSRNPVQDQIDRGSAFLIKSRASPSAAHLRML